MTRAFTYRPPTPQDGPTIWRLAGAVGLDVNHPYCYVLWGDYFHRSSSVAVTESGEIVGFITGFHPPSDPTALFIWQMGVAAEARAESVGEQMVDELLARSGVRWLEGTIAPSNATAATLFRHIARQRGADVEETLAYYESWFPEDHESEIRFRIGPLVPEISGRRPPAQPQTGEPMEGSG